jgi:hypothetical protein
MRSIMNTGKLVNMLNRVHEALLVSDSVGEFCCSSDELTGADCGEVVMSGNDLPEQVLNALSAGARYWKQEGSENVLHICFWSWLRFAMNMPINL